MYDRKLACFVFAVMFTLTAGHVYSATIAQTGFESSEGFTATGSNWDQGFGPVTTSDGAVWSGGVVGNNATAIWVNQAQTGSQSAVFGTANGNYVRVDPAGTAGVGAVQFWWASYSSTSTGPIHIEWTTDTLNGSETWTLADTVTMTASSPWAQKTVT